MPKKKRTPAQLAADKARSEKMKAALKVDASASEDIVQNEDVTALLRRIEELEARQFFQPQPAPLSTVRQVITKYSFNPKDYPDPRPRLFVEPRLARFAFAINYDLSWDVQKVNYEEDGQKYQAPRFVLEILGKVIDPDTNEVKKEYDPATKEYREKRYIVRRGMFFEDPDAFIFIANQHGREVPEELKKDFCDEMRYLTMRDWLLEYFYPPKAQESKRRHEEVIGNRLVEVYEINSTDPAGVGLDEMMR